jgi:type IV pilus assembly protein PilZ
MLDGSIPSPREVTVELRRFTRAPLERPLEFQIRHSDRRFSGLAKDISVGGMFVQTDEPAAFGAEVIVHLTLPSDRRELRLPGVVRWTSASGMGVQFGNLGVRETHAITEIVKQHET